MGSNGDGIGRLVMRGKTCEVKPAAPRGQAPNRGGKSHRNNRSGLRNQHQGHAHQVPSYGQNEQFPVVYQNDNYNLPYAQGMYPMVPGVPGYAPPNFHASLPHPSHSQLVSPPNGTIAPSADRNLGESGVVGPSYFVGSPLPATPLEHIPLHGTFPLPPQVSGHYQQQGFAFVPYAPNHGHSVLPIMTMPAMSQPVKTSTNANEDETNSNYEEIVQVQKD